MAFYVDKEAVTIINTEHQSPTIYEATIDTIKGSNGEVLQ